MLVTLFHCGSEAVRKDCDALDAAVIWVLVRKEVGPYLPCICSWAWWTEVCPMIEDWQDWLTLRHCQLWVSCQLPQERYRSKESACSPFPPCTGFSHIRFYLLICLSHVSCCSSSCCFLGISASSFFCIADMCLVITWTPYQGNPPSLLYNPFAGVLEGGS